MPKRRVQLAPMAGIERWLTYERLRHLLVVWVRVEGRAIPVEVDLGRACAELGITHKALEYARRRHKARVEIGVTEEP